METNRKKISIGQDPEAKDDLIKICVDKICDFYKIPSDRFLKESPLHNFIVVFVISEAIKCSAHFIAKSIKVANSSHAVYKIKTLCEQYPEFDDQIDELINKLIVEIK